MACGLPVIACAGSGIEEIVQDGYNGLLVHPRDSMGLGSAIRQLLEDPIRLEKMGKSARSYVVHEADSIDCLKRLEVFYESVLQND